MSGNFEALRNVATNPEIVGCINDAQEVLAFELPESERKSFLLFYDFITNPQPRFLTEWRSTARGQRWYHALVTGLYGDTQNAYKCVLYHFQRLSHLESKMMEKISKRNYLDALGNCTVGITNTPIWDFEYQAYVFAYRRCLDYMTRGLAAFFKHEFHSFRDLPGELGNWEPQNVANALAKVHKNHSGNFAFVMSAGGKTSVRDKIAHYEWVGVGIINLTRYGLVLVGGGEALNFTGNQPPPRLTEVLASRTRMLKACVDEMLTVFVTEARAWEAQRNL
jgi:hypothetical protein